MRLRALLAIVLLGLSFGAVSGTQAAADTVPDAGLPETVSADALPTWQINGVAWSQAVVGNTVYVGGSFTKARPPGTKTGNAAEVDRLNLMAYDITTGNLITSFNHSVNGQILRVMATPDGSRVYIAGDFTTVDGQPRGHIAAFDTATGALTSFSGSVSNRVRGIAVTNTTVYVGGNFFRATSGTTGTSSSRTRLAAFSAAGALLPWAPTADDNEVWTMAMAPSNTRVIIGGRFTKLNGATWVGIGAVDATTGASAPWSSRPTPTPDGNGNYSYPYDMYVDNGVLYVANDGEGGHWFDGRFAANPENGDLVWLDNCYGASYGVYATGGVVYSVSHAHDCTSLGAFPETNPTTWHRALATTAAATRTDQAAPGSNSNYSGQPTPTLLHWFPDLGIGTYTNQFQAAWTVRGNGTYVVLGGEFPSVNGTSQQGLTRFAIKSTATNKVGPVSSSTLTPGALSLQSGTARVSWQTTWDYDNETLTYEVLRDGGSTPVYTVTAKSNFWTLPTIGFVDTGLSPGSSHTYRVRVKDPYGNTVTSGASAAVTIASGATNGYVDGVLADGASKYWRLGESSGATAYDWAGFDDAAVSGTVTRGATGAVSGDAATTFDGSTGVAVANNAEAGPTTFSVEAWVNTTSTSGGKIVGFGGSATGVSGSYDRHVYMDNAGRIWFGVYPNSVQTVNSSASYNDGQWHHIVATLGSSGMTLYIDGKKVGANANTGAQSYSGYWRIGGDNLDGWPNQPASRFLAGTIDDVAVYPTVLTQTQIRAHYTASGRTVDVPATPTDPYGKAVSDSTPDQYWRLGETTGSTAVDTSGNDRAGTIGSGVTTGVAGAVAGTTDTAVGTNGTESGSVISKVATGNPTTYSVEALFRTTTTSGGKIIGFGAASSGTSNNYDRHVYMTNDGRLIFGAYTGVTNTITTAGRYNDGAWHHVVATGGPAGMSLYVDGVLVGTNANTGAEGYTGYWRIGGDNLGGWPEQPSSLYFNGSIDEFAVYSTQLSAATVAAHWSKTGLGAPAPNQAPTAAYTSEFTALAGAFDGSGSTDADGSVASYAWSFGDGATATGATATHTYAAAGDYTVTLTVTDDGGATNTVTRVVSPRPAANPATGPFASDEFGRTASGGFGIADTGGAWSVSTSTANYAVAGGVGQISLPTTGASRWAYLTGVSSTDTDLQVTFSTDKAATGNGIYLGAVGRRTAANTEYRVRARLLANGGVALAFTQLNGSTTETLIGAETTVPGLTVAAGSKLKVRLQVTGTSPTTLRAKVWTATGTEPAAWQLTTTDNTAALQAAGGVGVTGYLSGSSTNAPVVISVDDLVARPTNTAPTASFTASADGLTASVDGSGSTDAEGAVSYRWSFADGGTATGATASHVYTAPGTYRITLTVTDAGGLTDVTTRTVTVS